MSRLHWCLPCQCSIKPFNARQCGTFLMPSNWLFMTLCALSIASLKLENFFHSPFLHVKCHFLGSSRSTCDFFMSIDAVRGEKEWVRAKLIYLKNASFWHVWLKMGEKISKTRRRDEWTIWIWSSQLSDEWRDRIEKQIEHDIVRYIKMKVGVLRALLRYDGCLRWSDRFSLKSEEKIEVFTVKIEICARKLKFLGWKITVNWKQVNGSLQKKKFKEFFYVVTVSFFYHIHQRHSWNILLLLWRQIYVNRGWSKWPKKNKQKAFLIIDFVFNMNFIYGFHYCAPFPWTFLNYRRVSLHVYHISSLIPRPGPLSDHANKEKRSNLYTTLIKFLEREEKERKKNIKLIRNLFA